jgi:hypothetical protein
MRNLSKSTFASDPVKFEVVEIDLISEVDGFGRGATHSRGESEEKVVGKGKDVLRLIRPRTRAVRCLGYTHAGGTLCLTRQPEGVAGLVGAAWLWPKQ